MHRYLACMVLLLLTFACGQRHRTTITASGPATSIDEAAGSDFVEQPAPTTTSATVRASRGVPRTSPTTVRRPQKALETPSTTVAAPVISNGSWAVCVAHKVIPAVAHQCWDQLLVKYPWNAGKAFSVMYCESTGWSRNTNGIYHGLFQIENGPLDPEANVALAYDYYKRRGWQPWTCA